MKIQVVTYAPALGRLAAAHLARAARQAVSDRGRFTVAFSGGSTPAAMLQALADQVLPWDRIVVF